MYKLTALDHEFSKFCFYVVYLVKLVKRERLSRDNAISKIDQFIENEKFIEFEIPIYRPKFVQGIFNLVLTKYIEPDSFSTRTNIPQSLRGMLRRPCAYCGIDNPEHIDHIWPKALGGPDYDENASLNSWNFVQSCSTCNRMKSFSPLSCTANRFFLDRFTEYCELHSEV